MDFRETKRRDPVPDIQRLEQLVDSIRRGEIRLPKFQRPFVWDRDDMLDLWDSIYNGYPIGSVLLWHSSERLKSEREINGFAVEQGLPTDTYPTDYLLDGQQRLTTVCGALYWDGKDLNSQWAIHFDLETEKFVYAKRSEQINLFPLNKLLSTSDFIKQCMKFESSAASKRYYAAAEKLLRAVKDYKVAVVKIGDLTITEVAPIFERINSTGRKLTMVDLMRAATWKGGFDLSQRIAEFAEKIASCGIPEVTESAVLRSVAAASGLGVNKADIDGLRNLDSNKFAAAFKEAENAALHCSEFISGELAVRDFSYLPYSIQFTYLVELFRLAPRPTSTQLDEASKWFWRTSVTRYFGGASTGQNSRNLEEMRAFALGETSNLTPAASEIDLTDFLFSSANMRTAATTAFCLLTRKVAAMDSKLEEFDDALSGARKSRKGYVDLFAGTKYEGSNVGIAVDLLRDAQRGADLEAIKGTMMLSSSIDAPTEARVLDRAAQVCQRVSLLTGARCFFDAAKVSLQK